jgi:hypothetical protein
MVARSAIATAATKIPLRMKARGEPLRGRGLILTGVNTLIPFSSPWAGLSQGILDGEPNEKACGFWASQQSHRLRFSKQ